MSRVLVADDDAHFRRFVRIALTRAGHTVVEASNAASVRAAVDAETPDLLILDLDLGGPTGLDVARELRAQPRLSALPIVLCTSDAPTDLTGIQAVLHKPVDPDALVQLIARVVHQAVST